MRRVCRSKKNKKQDKQEENVLRVAAAAAEGGSALTVIQSGHFGHVPVPDGLVEPIGPV